jgi:gliding motility-associated-like protein
MVGDHTGDVGGRFMIVNASPEPNTFYVDTINGLCGGLTYEMAVFIANVLRPSSCAGKGVMPNLTFTIENLSGTVLHSYQTGDISVENQKVWKKFGTLFQAPAGVGKLILRIVNNAPGGINCGNDFALDDITFRACGPIIAAQIDGRQVAELDICENVQQPIVFAAQLPTSFIQPRIQWQLSLDTGKTFTDIPGEQSINFLRKNTPGGSYQYRAMVYEAANAASPACRFSSNITIVNINPMPVQTAPTKFFGCADSDFYLQSVEGTGLSYQWQGPNGFTASVKDPIIKNITYADSGLYQVRIITDRACERTDSFYIRVYPGTYLVADSGGMICEGEEIVLRAQGEGQFRWTPSTGLSDSTSPNPKAYPIITTYYRVMLTNRYGCKDSAEVVVRVNQKLRVGAGPDRGMFEGDTLILQGSVTGDPLDFYWLPNQWMNDAKLLKPIVSATDNIRYTLYATSKLGCPIQQDDVQISVYKKLRIPNSFSPNGDGIHDSWVIENGNTYPNGMAYVYSRNGSLVYTAKATAVNWNGTLQGNQLPVGTYYYVIQLGINRPAATGWIWLTR